MCIRDRCRCGARSSRCRTCGACRMHSTAGVSLRPSVRCRRRRSPTRCAPRFSTWRSLARAPRREPRPQPVRQRPARGHDQRADRGWRSWRGRQRRVRASAPNVGHLSSEALRVERRQSNFRRRADAPASATRTEPDNSRPAHSGDCSGRSGKHRCQVGPRVRKLANVRETPASHAYCCPGNQQAVDSAEAGG